MLSPTRLRGDDVAEAKIRLGAEDVSALGVPAEMTMDLGRLRVAEIRALRTAGYAEIEDLLAALSAEKMDALITIVWLACRRHGYTGTFDDIDFDLGDLALDVAGAGDGSPEGDTPQAGETSSSTPTSPPSRTSSRSTRTRTNA